MPRDQEDASGSHSPAMSDSELFAELEAELDDEDSGTTGAGFDMGEYRQKRMEELRKELAERPAHLRRGGDEDDQEGALQYMDMGVDHSQLGRYIRLDTEKEAVALLEKAGRKVVLHFSHAEFQRCKIMDRHLEVSLHARGIGLLPLATRLLTLLVRISYSQQTLSRPISTLLRSIPRRCSSACRPPRLPSWCIRWASKCSHMSCASLMGRSRIAWWASRSLATQTRSSGRCSRNDSVNQVSRHVQS